MLMSVNNNVSAMLSLGELNKNSSKLGKQLRKVSSGCRINGADDAASDYAIAKKMLLRSCSLEQGERNVQNGTALLKVAAGGIDSIVDELRNLKDLALKSANDTNTALDRATIQKEFDQRRANIDNIALETNYNGKILLDGTYEKKSIEVVTTVVIPGTSGSTTTGPATNPQGGTIGPTGTVIHSGVVEPTGTPVQINSSNYTIKSSGVYVLTSKSSDIVISSGVHDVKFISGSTSLKDIHITGPPDGNANIWIEDLHVTNTFYKDSFIQFLGSNNTLNFKGVNIIEGVTGGGLQVNAVIHVGGGLTVEGGTDGKGYLLFNDGAGCYGAYIGSNGDYKAENTNAPITVNSGTFQAVEKSGVYSCGAMIGSGQQSSIGDLTINGGTFIDKRVNDVVIGSGSATASCGNIKVSNVTITAHNKYADPVIGNGYAGGGCGNIYVTNSKIDVKNQAGSAIGGPSNGMNDRVSDITVENSELIVTTQTGAGIGTGENGRVGNITVNNCNLTNVVSVSGETVGRGVNGICGTVTIDGVTTASGQSGGTSSTSGTADQIFKVIEKINVCNPLVIHDDTKANQAIYLYINDMRAKSLKTSIFDVAGNLRNPEDVAYLRTLGQDSMSYQNYLDLLKEADGKSLEEVSVTTQHGASVALAVIDGAIEYALNEATTMGTYISHLEHAESNIVNARENTIASQSNIVDADIAKEMSSYMRLNVLEQASKAMLAQANNDSSLVLRLLS